MKMIKRVAALSIIGIFLSPAANAQWVFVARKAMGKIRQMQSEHADVAAVILEAPADNVFKTALKTVNSKQNLRILENNSAAKEIAFTDGERKVKMQVSELSDHVSELLISANVIKGKQSTTSLVVEHTLKICKEMKVECQLSGDK